MALPYFTEPDKIQGRRFGYGLGPYYPQLPDFTESVELSLYVDGQGVLNTGNTLLLHPERDPIDCVEVPKFDKKNKFIEGLSNTLDTLPIGTVILYPTYIFYGDTSSPAGGKSTMYPTDTPEGFVPCASQRLIYEDGTTIRVPSSTPIGMPVAYMMKVPTGWKKPDPVLPFGGTRLALEAIVSRLPSLLF